MKHPSIPSPIGFKVGGIHCGIKKRRKDLALIYSEIPATATGMFTANQIQAASVKLSKDVVSNGIMQAIIANSGNANALTGPQGEQDTLEMARATAGILGIDISKVAVASTGPIGKPLPIKIVVSGIERLGKKINSDSLRSCTQPLHAGAGYAQGRGSFLDAAQAILTTDTHIKFVSRQIELESHKITFTAIAKGAGMIYPHMATMLCFITTDLKITQPLLQDVLRKSVEQSFNCISVDGCTSTNDAVLVMANGMAENPIIDKPGDELDKVQDEFNHITKELAKMIVNDGEGATKLVEIEVNGTPTFGDARAVAFCIANYNLLKCSFFGETLNLGRIIAAIGAGPIRINPNQINIQIGNMLLLHNGEICKYGQPEMSQILRQKNIKIKIDLNNGEQKATVWTTDLSPKYVKINMD